MTFASGHAVPPADLRNVRWVSHCRDLVQLPVRFEQRIVIRTEMSRGALPVNGGVEQAADVGARDRAAMHAEADQATRELVHDHEHPVTPEHRSTRTERGPLSRGCRWCGR